MGFKIKKSIIYNMMNGSRVEYEFDNTKDFDYITLSRPSEESCSRRLLEELVEERISVLLKDKKKKVVLIFFIILIMVVCEAVIL